jgi:hypothetical protein
LGLFPFGITSSSERIVMGWSNFPCLICNRKEMRSYHSYTEIEQKISQMYQKLNFYRRSNYPRAVTLS